MKLHYFINCESIPEAKQLYKTLALLHHPDRGGDTATMQAINGEFEYFVNEYSRVYNSDQESKAETFLYQDVINSIISFNITIELIGNWIWVSGNTYEYRKQLKGLGFLFAPKKVMWFYRSEEFATRNRKEMDIDSIRAIHGSQVINNKSKQNQLPF